MINYDIKTLLNEAKELKASDLHITVGVPPKVRVYGALVDLNDARIMPDDAEELIKPIVVEPFATTFAEVGEVDFAYAIPGAGRYRVNVFRQRGSYALVIRLVNTVIPKPTEIGLPESIVDLTRKKRGLVLVTGPTGSGKSTTLASLINEINENSCSHIITLEDPIEYLHNHKRGVVNQREIGLDTGSYAQALRAALREDPDVILVGEMRDLETIQIAITAAETGHLVFSTLHTIGASNTIDRVIDVFPPHQQQQIRIQLASVLESVISQQLLPIQGGHGRVAAFEVMHANSAIKNLIRESKTHQIDSIIQINKKMGMQVMDDAIYELYLRRLINSETALNFAQDPYILEKKLF